MIIECKNLLLEFIFTENILNKYCDNLTVNHRVKNFISVTNEIFIESLKWQKGNFYLNIKTRCQ